MYQEIKITRCPFQATTCHQSNVSIFVLSEGQAEEAREPSNQNDAHSRHRSKVSLNSHLTSPFYLLHYYYYFRLPLSFTLHTANMAQNVPIYRVLLL
jgi:hypothetical protein